MRHTPLLVLAVAALVAVGCGDDEVSDATDRGTTAAQEAQEGLSPEARDVLDRGDALVSDIAEITQRAAEGDISSEEAQQELDAAAERAQGLASDAEELPATDQARDQITELAEQVQTEAEQLSAAAESGELSGASSRIAELREQAQATYGALDQELSESTRQRLEEAIEGAGG